MLKTTSFIFLIFVFTYCKFTPVDIVENNAHITDPDSNSVVEFWQYNTPLQWQGIEGDSISVILYKHDSLITTWIEYIPNSGTENIKYPVRSDWGSGNDFRILIKSNAGDSVFSTPFTIIPKVINSALLTLPKALQLGNKYYYWYHSYDDSYQYVVNEFYYEEVIDEQIFNDTSYMVVKRKDTGDTKYQRIDGTQLLEYKSGTVSLVYDLAWQDTNIVEVSRRVDINAELFCIYSKRIDITDYPHTQWPFRDRFQSPFGQTDRSSSKPMVGGYSVRLQAVELDGKVYGDTINPFK